jgi:hypothetical protein
LIAGSFTGIEMTSVYPPPIGGGVSSPALAALLIAAREKAPSNMQTDLQSTAHGMCNLPSIVALET